MIEIATNVFIGLAIAGVFDLVVIRPLFRLDVVLEDRKLRKRVAATGKLEAMTGERAKVLLGIKC